MTPDPNTLGYRRGARAAWVGIAGNVGLGIAKAVGGIVGGSAALLTDAAHSLSDSVSSVAVLIGMRVASRPPDEQHPYGHDRAEAIAGKTVSTMLVIFSLYMIYRSVAGIWAERHADTSRMGLALIVGLVSIFVKELMFQYKRRVGEAIGSSALIADAWHHRSDAFSSVVAVDLVAAERVHRAAGTLFGHSMPRLVQLEGHRLEAYLDGILLVFTHQDLPGIIGRVGTAFGELGVNIAQMTVGRSAPGGDAIGVLNLDQEPDAAAVAAVTSLTGIRSAKIVRLPPAGQLPYWLATAGAATRAGESAAARG